MINQMKNRDKRQPIDPAFLNEIEQIKSET